MPGLDDHDRAGPGARTRLTRGEAMPWFEEVPVRPVADALAAVRALSRRIARRPAARVRALLLLPAALSAMVCAIVIAAGFTGAQRPSHMSGKPPAARELILKTSRMCRSGMIRFPALSC
jgi:hypothetical protein